MADKKSTTPKADPFKTVVNSLSFHKFDEEPNFIGLYKDTVTLGADEDSEAPEKGKEPETYIANIFVDMSTGEEVYIGNSYAVNKAIKNARATQHEEITNTVFSIEFLGKTMVKNKPFNQFKIGYCSLEDYEASQK